MTKKKDSSDAKKYIKYFWIFSAGIFFLIILLFTLISLGLFGFMPSFEELENPKSDLASQIYSSDNVLLGTYYIENRSNVNYSEISPNVINALVATEDIRFEEHSGVDFKGVFRAIVKNMILFDKSSGGGSTITQQLAKNLFPRKSNASKFEIVLIKLKEWVTAIKLERNYSKQEIIAMYLNTVDFGSHAYGIKSAAATYFGTSPDSLKVEEAAVLIGLLKAPTWFSPVRNKERSLGRRNVVLAQMVKNHSLTKAQFDSISKRPIDISKFRVTDHQTGLATYFREYLRMQLLDWCKTKVKPDGSNYNLYMDGLRIYTTIDSRMQKYAEEAVTEYLGKELQPQFYDHWKGYKNAPFDRRFTEEDIKKLLKLSIRRTERYQAMMRDGASEEEVTKAFNTKVPMTVFTWKGERDTVMTPLDSIKYYKFFLNLGMMSMDPATGYVKAYVGGINYKHFMYDHVKLSRRQVGSTFKPFIYTLAMQEGEFSPCSKVPNVPVTFEGADGNKWTPQNSNDAREGEMVTLKWALANSVNYVSAYLMKHFSPQAVIQIARKMGVTSPIDEVPAICLGAADLSVYEMVGAYSTFANKGVYMEPIFVTRIEDKNGNVIESFTPKTQEAMSEETAYLMIELMKGVVESGTSVRLRYKYNMTNPIAGKTGTTQNNSDGWFMGITPELVTGIWVGGEDRSVHFRSITFGQGAHMALPVWAIYMKKVYADKKLHISQGDFEKPTTPLKVETDCDKYEQQKNAKEPIL